jgi:hypothetical protein
MMTTSSVAPVAVAGPSARRYGVLAPDENSISDLGHCTRPR